MPVQTSLYEATELCHLRSVIIFIYTQCYYIFVYPHPVARQLLPARIVSLLPFGHFEKAHELSLFNQKRTLKLTK